jgi:drug/metabolite transporter (DMT)-like permease
MSAVPAAGLLLCLASAACFGAMGIFGELAYEEHATVGTLLVVRFALASLALWAILGASGGLGRVRALTRSDLALALGLGAVGYSAQAGAYFTALQRIDPGLLALLLYTFPAIVAVAAIRLGRERASRRTATALGLTSAGLVLVLAGAGAGALDPAGALLALTAAVVYATYILSSEGIAGRTGPLVLATLVCTGATVTLTAGGLLVGDLDPGAVTAAGFGWLAAIAVVSTVAAVGLFFAGLARVGPTTASILSTFEPFVTVALAALAFGDRLSALQLVGGLLIVGGVVALNVRRQLRPATERALGGGWIAPSDAGLPQCPRKESNLQPSD